MKKLHRFLISKAPTNANVVIDDLETVHLIKNVLKLNVGEECIVFADGSDDYVCKITEITKKAVSLNVLSKNKKIPTPKATTACISIIKKDSFELVVQKLTELGIKKIVPIISDRTIKQSLRLDRLQKISDEALEQSGGSNRVIITEPVSLKEALEANKDEAQCYFDIEGKNTRQGLAQSFYIGPEGGWSDDDKALFREYNIESYKLSETVLRSETAAIVAAYTTIWS